MERVDDDADRLGRVLLGDVQRLAQRGEDATVGAVDRMHRLQRELDAAFQCVRHQLGDPVRDPLPGSGQVTVALSRRLLQPACTCLTGARPAGCCSRQHGRSRAAGLGESADHHYQVPGAELGRLVDGAAVVVHRPAALLALMHGDEPAPAQRRDTQARVLDERGGLGETRLVHRLAPETDRLQPGTDASVDSLLHRPRVGGLLVQRQTIHQAPVRYESHTVPTRHCSKLPRCGRRSAASFHMVAMATASFHGASSY